MINKTYPIDEVHIHVNPERTVINEENCGTNSQFLRTWSENLFKSSKELATSVETWDDIKNGDEYFCDRGHLSEVQRVVWETTNKLLQLITYKPQLKTLENIRKDLICCSVIDYEPQLISYIVDDCYWQYKPKYDYTFDKQGTPEEHYAIIARELRAMIKKLCKIMDENEIGFMFR